MNEREVTIPEAAIKAGAAALWGSTTNSSLGVAKLTVTAAAPHIDRAARIDELRRLLNRQELGSIDWGEPGPVVEGSFIEQRLLDLEAQSDA